MQKSQVNASSQKSKSLSMSRSHGSTLHLSGSKYAPSQASISKLSRRSLRAKTPKKRCITSSCTCRSSKKAQIKKKLLSGSYYDQTQNTASFMRRNSTLKASSSSGRHNRNISKLSNDNFDECPTQIVNIQTIPLVRSAKKTKNTSSSKNQSRKNSGGKSSQVSRSRSRSRNESKTNSQTKHHRRQSSSMETSQALFQLQQQQHHRQNNSINQNNHQNLLGNVLTRNQNSKPTGISRGTTSSAGGSFRQFQHNQSFNQAETVEKFNSHFLNPSTNTEMKNYQVRAESNQQPMLLTKSQNYASTGNLPQTLQPTFSQRVQMPSQTQSTARDKQPSPIGVSDHFASFNQDYSQTKAAETYHSNSPDKQSQQVTVNKSQTVSTAAGAALSDKWHSVLNSLECFFRDRMFSLREKVSSAVLQNAYEDEVVKMLLNSNDTKLFGEQRLNEIICEGFQLDQELKIEQLTKQLLVKDTDLAKFETTVKDLIGENHHVKKQFAGQVDRIQGKLDQQVKQAKVKGVAQRTEIDELQKQLIFYRTQTEDLQEKLRSDLKRRELDQMAALQDTAGVNDKIRGYEDKVSLLMQQVEHLSGVRGSVEVELERQKDILAFQKTEFENSKQTWHQQCQLILTDQKKNIKDKMRNKMEQFERTCEANMRAKIEEVERSTKESAHREMDDALSKFEDQIRRTHLPMHEHEIILKQEVNRLLLQHGQDIRNEKEANETEVRAAENRTKDQFSKDEKAIREQYTNEESRLRGIIQQLEHQVESMQAGFKKDLNIKEIQLQEFRTTKDQETMIQSREKMEFEQSLRQQLHEAMTEQQSLESELKMIRLRHEEETKQGQAREEQLCQDFGRVNQDFEALKEHNAHLSQREQELFKEKEVNLELREQLNCANNEIMSRANLQEKTKTDCKGQVKELVWKLQKIQTTVFSLRQELAIMQKSIANENEAAKRQFEDHSQNLLALITKQAKELADQSAQVTYLQAKYDGALSQIELSKHDFDQVSDQNKSLMQRVEQADLKLSELETDLQSQQSQFQQHERRKEAELKISQQNLMREQIDANRLHDKIKLHEDTISKQAKENAGVVKEIQTLKQEQERLVRSHNSQLKSTESQLQQHYEHKIGKKIQKLQDVNEREVENLRHVKEQEVQMINMEKEEAYQRAYQLERLVKKVKLDKERQRQKSRQSENEANQKLNKIEREVSRSLAKVLKRSAKKNRAAALNATTDNMRSSYTSLPRPLNLNNNALRSSQLTQSQQYLMPYNAPSHFASPKSSIPQTTSAAGQGHAFFNRALFSQRNPTPLEQQIQMHQAHSNSHQRSNSSGANGHSTMPLSSSHLNHISQNRLLNAQQQPQNNMVRFTAPAAHFNAHTDENFARDTSVPAYQSRAHKQNQRQNKENSPFRHDYEGSLTVSAKPVEDSQEVDASAEDSFQQVTSQNGAGNTYAKQRTGVFDSNKNGGMII